MSIEVRVSLTDENNKEKFAVGLFEVNELGVQVIDKESRKPVFTGVVGTATEKDLKVSGLSFKLMGYCFQFRNEFNLRAALGIIRRIIEQKAKENGKLTAVEETPVGVLLEDSPDIEKLKTLFVNLFDLEGSELCKSMMEWFKVFKAIKEKDLERTCRFISGGDVSNLLDLYPKVKFDTVCLAIICEACFTVLSSDVEEHFQAILDASFPALLHIFQHQPSGEKFLRSCPNFAEIFASSLHIVVYDHDFNLTPKLQARLEDLRKLYFLEKFVVQPVEDKSRLPGFQQIRTKRTSQFLQDFLLNTNFKPSCLVMFKKVSAGTLAPYQEKRFMDHLCILSAITDEFKHFEQLDTDRVYRLLFSDPGNLYPSLVELLSNLVQFHTENVKAIKLIANIFRALAEQASDLLCQNMVQVRTSPHMINLAVCCVYNEDLQFCKYAFLTVLERLCCSDSYTRNSTFDRFVEVCTAQKIMATILSPFRLFEDTSVMDRNLSTSYKLVTKFLQKDSPLVVGVFVSGKMVDIAMQVLRKKPLIPATKYLLAVVKHQQSFIGEILKKNGFMEFIFSCAISTCHILKSFGFSVLNILSVRIGSSQLLMFSSEEEDLLKKFVQNYKGSYVEVLEFCKKLLAQITAEKDGLLGKRKALELTPTSLDASSPGVTETPSG
eukprot:maker-scaffold_12-snap-gene-5.24-mRNA-1 protein AED:0.26 eAED:0.26 QI:30/1/1/1/1/1/2/83/662